MIREIKNRLQVIERTKKNSSVPDLVLIFWDETRGQWVAKEQYVKKSARGTVLPNSGKVKLIPLNNPEDYIPPEGFKGTVLMEGDLE